MSDTSSKSFWSRRLLFAVSGLIAFLLFFVVALRITVREMFRGIETSRATGLSAVSSWDIGSMWSARETAVDDSRIGPLGEASIARSADLRARSSSFDLSVAALHQCVSAHRGYFEDLHTERRSGHGRVLAATLSVVAADFDAALSDLKMLGRIEAISETGEDFTIKLASAERHLAAAQTKLSRLQKLQHEQKGALRDTVDLEKDISQANEAVTEASRQREGLASMVLRARIRVTLIEDYRAPLEANFRGTSLQLRNSLVEGVRAILSSTALFIGVLLEYGLPLLFWMALAFWPSKLAWRRIAFLRSAH